MWRQVVSQTPREATSITGEHPYALAAAQLNRLIRGGRSLSGNERNCVFLNLDGKEFATASSVAGFDFKDDGRAIAKCDWDYDGDLDFWVANRSAPQVRYMENAIGSKNNFIAFRLQGTNSNRDAIGARVELEINETQTLIQAIRAGEGFLAQSSKTVHFGLGKETSVSSLSVRWPNGTRERFSVPSTVNRFYTLIEGSGAIEPWDPPKTNRTTIANHALPPPAFNQATINPLGLAFPMPPLRYTDKNGEMQDATDALQQALAINLWASWCAPCIEELAEWQTHRAILQAANIRVLAVSVETDSIPNDVIKKLRANFDVGIASESMLETIQLVHNTIYDHHLRIPIPTTLLLNASGHLVAIYKGSASAEQLVDGLRVSRKVDPDSRLPFVGRWVGKLGPYKLPSLASALWDAGFTSEALQFADRVDPEKDAAASMMCRLSLAHRLKQASQIGPAMDQLQLAYKVAPKDADVNLRIGALHAEFGKLPLAVGHFLIALENSSEPRADIHASLGASLRRLKENQDALRHLAKAVQLNPNLAVAQYNLGLLHASQSNFLEAKRHFEHAVTLESGNSNFRINYAMALSQSGEHNGAIAQLERVLASEPDSLTARIYKGEVYAEAKQTTKAIAEFQHVLRVSPKATRVWMRLGELQELQGELRNALASFENALALAPNDPRPTVRIAWILATAPDASLRDGRRALKLAESMVVSTGRKQPSALDALAAAYAENGDFPLAVKTCSEAIALLANQHAPQPKKEMSARLQQYKQRQKHRTVSRD